MDLVIWYRSGKKNAGADALSRLPVDWHDNGNSSLQVPSGIVKIDWHDNGNSSLQVPSGIVKIELPY